MIEPVNILKSEYKKLDDETAGKSAVNEIQSALGTAIAEAICQAGFYSVPTASDAALKLSLTAGGKEYVIATINYNLDLQLQPGESVTYSTDGAGSSVQSKIHHKADGTAEHTATAINLNGSGKSFVTHAELDSALQTLVGALNTHIHPTPAGPSSPPSAAGTIPPPGIGLFTLNISSAATTTVKTGG